MPKMNTTAGSIGKATRLFLGYILLIVISACTGKSDPSIVHYDKKMVSNFLGNPYWYSGTAEINVYQLNQERYGDQRNGKVIFIQTTEDFLYDKQVKNEIFQDQNSTSILKSIMIKRFETGVYDYSLMTSVFTPVDKIHFPNTLKVTYSSQDWCGQSFQQVNLRGNRYESSTYSYFAATGDKKEFTDATFLEDELMNCLRMDPAFLPVGTFEMIPSLEFCRLFHVPFRSYRVQSKLNTLEDQEGSMDYIYEIIYPDLDRKKTIVFEEVQPFRIISSKEEYFNQSTGLLSTSEWIRDTTIQLDYWKHNAVKDSVWRNVLYM
ncbi:MAG TPA: hypothetical protein PKC30_05940 [Saprospiraceae bacterium]|nr:hypothetical protein [Saprospiraceae bacterium]